MRAFFAKSLEGLKTRFSVRWDSILVFIEIAERLKYQRLCVCSKGKLPKRDASTTGGAIRRNKKGTVEKRAFLQGFRVAGQRGILPGIEISLLA
jgi:hypothetical protein